MTCGSDILWPSGAPTGATCGLEAGHGDDRLESTICVDTAGMVNPFREACIELGRLLGELEGALASPARAHGQRAQNYSGGGGGTTFAQTESEALHEVLCGPRHLTLIRDLKRFHGTLVRIPWESQQMLMRAFAVRGSGHGSEGDAKTVAIGGPSAREEHPAHVRQHLADVGVRRLLTYGKDPGVNLYDVALWLDPHMRELLTRVAKTAGDKTTQKAVEAHRVALTNMKWRAWQHVVPDLERYESLRQERLAAEKLARESEKAQRSSQIDARIERLQAGAPKRGPRMRAPEHKVFSDEEAERIRRWVRDLQGGEEDPDAADR